jgi:hypothetical protein
MTTAEKNAAIAEACGWNTNGVEWRKGDSNEAQDDPPDYCNDLNAMQQAAEWLRVNDEHAYGCMCSWIYQNFFVPIWATAQQRADAFLRTIGKWVD